MKSLTAESLLNTIDLTVNNINLLASNNIMQYSINNPLSSSYISGYLITFMSGIYEESIEIILREKIMRSGRKYIINYVNSMIHEKFRNPTYKNVRKLLEKFDKNWVEKLKTIPDRNKTALSSVVNSKNALAHGVTFDVTLAEAIQYYNDSRVVIERLDDIIL